MLARRRRDDPSAPLRPMIRCENGEEKRADAMASRDCGFWSWVRLAEKTSEVSKDFGSLRSNGPTTRFSAEIVGFPPRQHKSVDEIVSEASAPQPQLIVVS